MMACITMHNVTVVDDQDEDDNFIYDQMGEKTDNCFMYLIIWQR
jgi:hypothetical protein